jgi:hypothetical protein
MEWRQLIETKKTSYKKWLASEKLWNKIEYKIITALTKTKVACRQRVSWDKFVTNLEHETYWTKTEV